eukprot:TRINITY_DN54242_c0_g1_i1.p1 TRINITY_DN54242_c0_g1~~TRINITY_DN54242_c0_g1_i1.p1  ORF type:complete len:1126 (-),score=276.04 TRINITY_DN54242_c0_g1_i1:79-3456(-)
MPEAPAGFAVPFLQARDVAKLEIPEGASTVLLGECTHGTEEFYRMRAEITKYLIEVRGFKIVLCEADWPFLWHANQYIHRKRKTMFPREEDGDRVRFPDWMWRNRPFVELIEWMRKRASHDGPFLLGMDCYCKDESKEEVMRFLDRHDKGGLGKMFRQACYPQERPDTWPDVLAKLQWEIENEGDSLSAPSRPQRSGGGLARTKFRGCTKLDQFNCEQNLECMISAHEYYSKQRLEPPGSRASWNARDQHMMTVLLRLKEQSQALFNTEDVKVVVWAHNSHVGDASATPMGGAEFTRNEKWNLGQMCRSTLQNVFIVGFYSYCGTVRAAEKWGGEGKVMQLNEAVPSSIEQRLHDWFQDGQGMLALRRLQEALPQGEAEPTYRAGCFPLNVEYQALHGDLRFSREFDPDSENQEASDVNDEANRDLNMMQVRSIRADPSEPFVAVRRATCRRSGAVRLQTRDGLWVTEFTPGGSRTIHCLPKERLDELSGPLSELTDAKLLRLAQFPILQRWVGVQYHPATEISSHYGEMVIGKCYDLLVFADRTNALDVDFEAASGDGAVGSGAPVQTSAQTNKRLLIEYRRIMRTPIEKIAARPLDTNILEWHFVLEGCQEPYTGGRYHGILEFPEDFPMKPPSIKMLTPSGRFEINRRICLSMSDFHAESWNPSWTIEKILIGLMSFMYEESTASIGSILESFERRKRYAAESEYFNVQNDIYCELFCAEMGTEELLQKQKSRKLYSVEMEEDVDENNEHGCRFCLLDTGELVSPCACKGSGKFVHPACLRQWQKSVMLTQPTHPKYQTQIDAICNVCETPFKDPYKPVSRRAAIMEYIKESDDGPVPLAEMVKLGNFIVSTRAKSTRNQELVERTLEAAAAGAQDSLKAKLGHFTQAVYFITMHDRVGRRGNGSVLAVNIEQQRRIARPLAVVEDRMPGMPGSMVSPLRAWQEHHVPLMNSLFGPGTFDLSAIEHFIGGPVEPASALSVTELANFDALVARSPELAARASSKLRKLRIKNDLFFGDLDTILSLAGEYVAAAAKLRPAAMDETASTDAGSSLPAVRVTIKVFWGYASWDGTQLLGEIARCGWGLLECPESLGMVNGMWDKVSTWEQVVDSTRAAQESEYSRA